MAITRKPILGAPRIRYAPLAGLVTDIDPPATDSGETGAPTSPWLEIAAAQSLQAQIDTQKQEIFGVNPENPIAYTKLASLITQQNLTLNATFAEKSSLIYAMIFGLGAFDPLTGKASMGGLSQLNGWFEIYVRDLANQTTAYIITVRGQLSLNGSVDLATQAFVAPQATLEIQANDANSFFSPDEVTP